MANKYKHDADNPLGPGDIVPGTSYTVNQICRVRRAPKEAAWEPGMILAFNGAWDRKCVVVSVTDLGVEGEVKYYSGPRQMYGVVIQRLGSFYADGNHRLSPSKPRQEFLHVAAGEPPSGSMGSWMLVIPEGDSRPYVKPVPKPPKPPKLQPPPPGFVGSGTPTWIDATPKPQPTPAPEAILDMFRLKSSPPQE